MFFGGFVRMHILYHATREDIFGVEMMEELRRHGYDVGPGTLYPMLQRLEEAGYLTCHTEVVAGKQRKYYRATAEGARALEHTRPATCRGRSASTTLGHRDERCDHPGDGRRRRRPPRHFPGRARRSCSGALWA